MKMKRFFCCVLLLALLVSFSGLFGKVQAAILGDFDGNNLVTDADAIYLLRYTLFPSQYPINGNADYNQDGNTTDADAIYLLRHTLFPAKYPLASTQPEKVKLTVGLLDNARVLSYDDNALTDWIEETCGVELEFLAYAPGTDIVTQISTTIAARQELPDILFGVSLNEDAMRRYGKDGYLLNLNKYYEDQEGASKNFWTRMGELSAQDQQSILTQLKDPDTDAIYSVPTVQQSIDSAPHQVWINAEWLDKVGMEKPTNTAELVAVLRAFAETDCNGNGIDDEIPLFGSNKGGAGADILGWIINMFVYYDSNNPYIVDESGKLVRVETTDAYREALKFINDLYTEDLLTDLAFVASATEMKLVTSPTSGTALCGIFVGNLTTHTVLGNPVLNQYVALPTWGCAPLAAPVCTQNNFITADCDNPDKAFEVLMAMWSQEGSYRVRYGAKGVNWDDPDPGALSPYGLPAQFKIINDALFQQNIAHWGTVACVFDLYCQGETAQQQIWDTSAIYRNALTVEYAMAYKETAKRYNPPVICPPLVLTEAEQEQTDMERTNVNNYIRRSLVDFCSGSIKPYNDAAWNSYLTTLNNLGLSTVVQQAQTVYDRQ